MTLGVISAMQIEVRNIIAAMDDCREESVGSLTFYIGKIGNTDVVCAVCGIGKVFAAICAQTMIIKYAPDCIVNTGIGGSLSNELSIGDIAVSEALVQHDMDTSPLGDPVGMISGINIIEIPADRALRDRICAIAENMGMKTLCGVIASGDTFVADRAKKTEIVRCFGAVACEMEGAAIAQAAYVNKVPFCVVRAVSDTADGNSVVDYPAFAAHAAENSARVVIALAQSLN